MLDWGQEAITCFKEGKYSRTMGIGFHAFITIHVKVQTGLLTEYGREKKMEVFLTVKNHTCILFFLSFNSRPVLTHLFFTPLPNTILCVKLHCTKHFSMKRSKELLLGIYYTYEPPSQSWKVIGPSFVSALKLGKMSPRFTMAVTKKKREWIWMHSLHFEIRKNSRM